MESNSGQPCDVCGDIGYATAIATCSKCHKTREHIYCMQPNICNVPKSWHCEACRYQNMGNLKRYRVEEVHDSSGRQKKWAAGNISKVPGVSKAIVSPSGKPVTYLSSRKFGPKKVETGKIKFLPVEDACKLSSGANPNPSSLQGGSSSQIGSIGTNNRPIPKRIAVAVAPEKDHKSAGRPKPLMVGRVQTTTLQTQTATFSQQLHGLKSPSHFPCKSSTFEALRNVAVITTRDKRHISDEAYCSPLNQREFKNTLAGLDKHAGEVYSLVGKNYVCKEEPVDAVTRCGENGTSNSKASIKFGEEDLPNPPAVNASWEGSFEILNLPHELYDGFQAYPPGKVSRKAYLVSKQMPRVLQPRGDVWPETFHTDFPSGFDIALYFWAEYFCRSREKYNHLLELMEKRDLCMHSRLNGVELIIFTSRQLPVESQRMNKQFYLWGVFLSLEGQHSCDDLKGKPHELGFPLPSYKIEEDSAYVNHEADDQVVDMEVDMVGGKDVMIVDKCLSRAGCWDNSDIPSQDVFAAVNSDQLIEKSDVARHLHQMKREQCDDLDAPPGFSRPVTSDAADKGPIAVSLMKMSPVAHKVDSPPGFSKSIKLVEGKEVKNVDKCMRNKLGAACWDNSDIISQHVFARVNSDQPIEKSVASKHLHQMEIEQHDDFDAPPGFPRPTNSDVADKVPIAVSLVKMSPVAHTVDSPPGFSKSIKLVEGKEVKSVGKCLRNNFGAPCWDNSDITSQHVFTRVNSDQPIEKSAASEHLHQMKRDQHDDFDAPPGFPRPVTSDAADKGPVAVSLMRISSVAHEVDSPPSFSKPIKLVGGKEVKSLYKCLRNNSGAACWEHSDISSQHVFTRINSDQPIEKSAASEHLHRMKRDQHDDLDAPPGFPRPATSDAADKGPIAVSLMKMSSVAHEVDSPISFSKSVNLVGGKKVKSVDECLRNDSGAACWDKSDIPSHYMYARVNSDQQIDKSASPRHLHQMKREQCDAPPGFPRPVTSDAADKVPIAPSLMKMSLLAHEVDSPPGFSKSIKREGRESSSKGSPPVSSTSLKTSSRNGSVLHRFKPLQNELGCFSRLCNVAAPGIVSFMQHLGGKRHAASVQRIVTATRSKEEDGRKENSKERLEYR